MRRGQIALNGTVADYLPTMSGKTAAAKFRNFLDSMPNWRQFRDGAICSLKTSESRLFGWADQKDMDRPNRACIDIWPYLLSPDASDVWSTIRRWTQAVANELSPKDTIILVQSSVLIDPPGSTEQSYHTDIYNHEIHKPFNLWIFYFPLSINKDSKEMVFEASYLSGTKSQFHHESNDMTVTLADGMQRHRGVGNRSSSPRLFLQLVYTQVTFSFASPSALIFFVRNG